MIRQRNGLSSRNAMKNEAMAMGALSLRSAPEEPAPSVRHQDVDSRSLHSLRDKTVASKPSHRDTSADPHTKDTSQDTALKQVLIIDDDLKFSRLLHDYLEPFGYALQQAGDGFEGVRKVEESLYDAVILDVMLPGIDGLEVLRRLGAGRRVPVLMLTARGDEADRILGLEMGADDYVPKTVSPREILARLRALTRRQQMLSQMEKERPIQVGALKIRAGARQASIGGKPLTLTSFEFDLLLSLARSAGRIRSREQLLQEAASRPLNVFDRSIDVHISSLRRKLGDDPKRPNFIVTVRNTGYMMREGA